MKLIKLLLSKVLSHPSWTGIGSLVAMIALIVALLPSYDIEENEEKKENSRAESDTPPSRSSPHNKSNFRDRFISQRIALLIGINEYEGDFRLKNSVSDINAIAVSLKKQGFKIIKRINPAANEIKDAIEDFQTLLSLGGVGLAFYSGHGMQIEGEDYIIPRRAATKIKSENDVPEYAINFSKLLEPVDKILEESPKNNGSIVVYAAESGSESYDGTGHHSPFTEAFLQGLERRDFEFFDFYRHITKSVSSKTNGSQIPWVSASVDSEFYFADRDYDRNIGLLKILFFDSCRNDPFRTHYAFVAVPPNDRIEATR